MLIKGKYPHLSYEVSLIFTVNSALSCNRKLRKVPPVALHLQCIYSDNDNLLSHPEHYTEHYNSSRNN